MYIKYGAVVLLIVLCGIGLFILGQKTAPFKPTTSSEIKNVGISPQLTKITTVKAEPEVSVSTISHFTGTLHKISEDLGVVITSKNDALNHVTSTISYYEAGTFMQGKYNGYTRYVALKESSSNMQGWSAYVLATQDKKSFILDGKPKDLLTITTEDYDYQELNMKKISQIDHLTTPEIVLDSHFSLNKGDIMVGTNEKAKDSYSAPIYSYFVQADFSHYTALKSFDPELKLYVKRNSPTSGIAPQDNIKDTYIDTNTEIIAVDSTGLGYRYSLMRSGTRAQYDAELAQYQTINSFQYDKGVTPPIYPLPLNLHFSNSDIQTKQPLYHAYNLAIPEVCATGINTVVTKNITENELQLIGTSSIGNIYVLKDKNHPLLKEEFRIKVVTDKEQFKILNVNTAYPTYDEYVAKNPLLFFKDYWGRWIADGEYDYMMTGGCGKPVIYLYPTIPTQITLSFFSKMQLTTAIPSYYNLWKVLAQPDGTLQDLQPQFTQCSTIDITRKGSEYAKEACEKNTYPYIYWAGNSLEKQYPVVTKGWIVNKNNLKPFIENTLNNVGFSKIEKSDFMDYWIPEMESKNAPYYKISFLGTMEMNKLVPMVISPKPDTFYRFFMDYIPLSSQPAVKLEPQSLAKIHREGFTVVEWGGTKR